MSRSALGFKAEALKKDVYKVVNNSAVDFCLLNTALLEEFRKFFSTLRRSFLGKYNLKLIIYGIAFFQITTLF